MVSIDIFKLWQAFLADNNIHQGGIVRPQRNFQAWVNEIVIELFKEHYAQFEKNNIISDQISPFLKTVNVIISTQNGVAYDIVPRPADYAYFASARIMRIGDQICACPKKEFMNAAGECRDYVDPDYEVIRERNRGSELSEKRITKVDNQKWTAAIDHAILCPTPDRPLITQYDAGFKIAPKGLGIMVLDYFRYPKECVFNYTIDSDDNIIYNPTGSVSPEWSDTLMNDFLARLKRRYGSLTGSETKYGEGAAETAAVKQ